MSYEKLLEHIDKEETKKKLVDGKVLQVLKERFMENPSNQTLIPFIDCLTDSYVYMPIIVKLNEIDKEQFLNSNTGDIVKLNENMGVEPEFLITNDGRAFLPIFSNKEDMKQFYKNNVSIMHIHISQVIEIYKRLQNSKLSGILLDASNKDFIFNEEFGIEQIIAIMDEKEKNLSKEVNQ